MIIQVTKEQRISFDILHLEGFVIASVVQNDLESLSALDKSLSAIQTEFPNLVVNYLIRPKDIGAEDPDAQPEEIVEGLVWIKIRPPGYFLAGLRLEPMDGDTGERALGWRNQRVIARSIKKCRLEFANQ